MTDFSFLSTIYNNVNRVNICLDSILYATDGLDVEIIIVDNFSTDGSFEILQKYAHSNPNIRIFRQECSRGFIK